MWSQVSGCLLQTAQTWANAGVCSASCAHAFGCIYVCLFVITCLFVLQAICGLTIKFVHFFNDFSTAMKLVL